MTTLNPFIGPVVFGLQLSQGDTAHLSGAI